MSHGFAKPRPPDAGPPTEQRVARALAAAYWRGRLESLHLGLDGYDKEKVIKALAGVEDEKWLVSARAILNL